LPQKSKKILVAPLDWGLGHATRCIPIIKKIQAKGGELLIAGDGEIAKLLQDEFPDIRQIPLKGYNLKYFIGIPAWLSVTIQIPKIVIRIWQEHYWLKRIVDEEGITNVISDNRFGLWNKKIHSVYITHQVMIKCPNGLKIFEQLLYLMHRFFISRYSECWIPDFASNKNNLSGDLSHKYPLPLNAKYIGLLSRFVLTKTPQMKFDLAAIVSGAEPQRSIFEKQIANGMEKISLKTIILQGKPSENRKHYVGKQLTVSHLNSRDLESIICASQLVLCRAGYSGIMDLIRLKKNAVLIPTPGQTEQEYLADELMKKRIFFSMKQEVFDLRVALQESKKYSVENFKEEQNADTLMKTLTELMDY
jgi:UDP-N-acetylglucosamine transferase subunit ALG13